MTEERLPLAELLAKVGDEDFLRTVAEAVVQMLMEADVARLIGARHERSGERTTYRNGYRDRIFETRLASLQLRIPKLRQGSYFPPFLEPRRTTEKALVAVIQEAWFGGVSTRKVDDLVQAMGLCGISKSTVSKLCRDIDERVGAFLTRPLTGSAVSVAGRDLSAPARGWPGGLGGSDNRCRGQHRRQARDCRPAHPGVWK